jgi:Conserved TM helix
MWDQVRQSLDQSTVGVLSRLASLLPAFLALLVAVLFSLALAWVVAVILRRVLASIRFDQRMESWGVTLLTDYSPQHSPSRLITRAVAWAIVLAGLVLGLGAVEATLTSELTMRLFEYLPNVAIAVLVLIVGSIVARYLARTVLIESVNMNLHYARLLSLGVKWLVMVCTIAMALDHLEIGSRIVPLAFATLFGGIVLALALAVGLGSIQAVSRSLERESSRIPTDTEEPIRHM